MPSLGYLKRPTSYLARSTNHKTNSSTRADHNSLSEAALLQEPPCLLAMNLRRGSSHFIQRLRDGRSGLRLDISIAPAFQSESRQKVTRHNQVLASRLAACPAQCHFLTACACSQSLTPASLASCQDLVVALLSHGIHYSVGCRCIEQILRNILL